MSFRIPNQVGDKLEKPAPYLILVNPDVVPAKAGNQSFDKLRMHGEL